jgi:adenine deaminase
MGPRKSIKSQARTGLARFARALLAIFLPSSLVCGTTSVEPVVFLPSRRYPDSMGRAPSPNFCLVGGTVVDVRAGERRRAAVAVTGDRITAVGDDRDLAAGASRTVDVRGGVIVPGYIEPHTHSILANPAEMAYAVGAHGTTTAVVDGLPLMMTVPPDRLAGVMEMLSTLPITLRWLIRLHPQSFGDEDAFSLPGLRSLWRQPFAAAVGEVTRWPDVLAGDADLLAKIAAAREDGRRVEGHAPGASLERLTGLAAAGFTSCHEAITAAEVTSRLSAGLYAMLRDSSIRPDLPELLKGIPAGAIASGRVMLTVDGPSPFFLADHGYQDRLVTVAIDAGIDPMDALRMVTVNPADYFGFSDRGEIAVGRRADLVVLEDLADPRPSLVMAGGEIIAEDGRHAGPPPLPWPTMIPPPDLPDLPGGLFAPVESRLPTVRFVNDVILEHIPDGAPSALNAMLVDRHGRWATRCALAGFADHLGGLATTISSAFDVLIIGDDPDDMAAAYRRLKQQRGGIAVVDSGHDVFSLPLELGGIFSSRPWDELVEANRTFLAVLRTRGYRYADPLFSLLFLTFDSLPWVRMTSRGIWDVRHRTVIYPSEPIQT